MESQSEGEIDLNARSADDSIVYIILYEIKYIRVRVNTLTIIKNLPVTNTNILEILMSRLPIRDIFIISSLTGLSGKVVGRRKGQRKIFMVD